MNHAVLAPASPCLFDSTLGTHFFLLQGRSIHTLDLRILHPCISLLHPRHSRYCCWSGSGASCRDRAEIGLLRTQHQRNQASEQQTAHHARTRFSFFPGREPRRRIRQQSTVPPSAAVCFQCCPGHSPGGSAKNVVAGCNLPLFGEETRPQDERSRRETPAFRPSSRNQRLM